MSYTKTEINRMNNKYPYQGCIKFGSFKEPKTGISNNLYNLYPTGYCSLTTGREYVAVSIYEEINNSNFKKKYNII